MQEKTDVIIIRGAPGSGKSETAKALSHYFPKGVRLEVDTLRNMVVSVDWTNQKEHITLLEISARLTLQFLSSGFKPVIVVDTFSGDKLTGFLEILKQQNAALFINIIGLYASEESLKNRLDNRTDGLFKDFEISKKLNAQTLKNKFETELQIDTTTLTKEKTAFIINTSLSISETSPFKEV